MSAIGNFTDISNTPLRSGESIYMYPGVSIRKMGRKLWVYADCLWNLAAAYESNPGCLPASMVR